MGFSTQNQGQPSPATKRYSWRGGEHLDPAEGKYRFSYYDNEKGENVEAKLPFEFWFLENTIGIGGGGDGYYYWTNEAAPADWQNPGSVMTLHKTTFASDGSRVNEVLARGTYAQIKEAVGTRNKDGKLVLPSDMKYLQNYYFYNPESKEIEVFRMQGSANGAFITFTSKNKGWGQKKVRMSVNEELKKTGAVYFYEPKFEIAGDYTPEEMELMTKKDQEVLDYIKSLYAQGGQNEGTDPTIDQTPAQYQGEENQETGGAGEEISLEDVPFI